MTESSAARVGVVWRGRPGDPDPELSGETRLSRVFEVVSRGLVGVPVVYYGRGRSNGRGSSLLGVDAALVWVDPISGRAGLVSVLDPMLRDVASRRRSGSARTPDVILKMGMKEVLVQTRLPGLGS